ncbi:MAG: arylsulfatase [Lachnospiraceae bacterium]|nr:arylsulfatase [Lachnospiraceae bacterium]
MSKKFNGYEGFTLQSSRLSFTEEPKREKTNVVYIVLDDVGFAQLGCYGSNIHTPNMDRLAAEGLRYNNFHTTAICSATRASLLTGANHHAAGVATVVDTPNGFPNNQGHLNPSYATLAEVLKENGYATFAVGKWHLAPLEDVSDQGPYDNWPLAKGFDRFYGFMEGYTDQYHPALIQDNSAVKQPKDSKDGYHLSEDLSDHAIHYLFQHTNAYPEKPFFLYLAYGAGHSPHQVPQKYIDHYKGAFDEGWDVIRDTWFENQKKSGIIPADAELTERNQYVKAWDSLNADEKKLYARYMETFAGFLEHTDEQIGRVLDYLEEIGELDNSIVVLLSDNGASAEGGKEGRFSQERALDMLEEGIEAAFALSHIDEIGTEWSAPHYPIGWANAGNTPFQWYKSFVHSGGVKDPLIVRYPKGIKNAGGVRSQYHHVSDITPTVLEALHIEKPEQVKGVNQLPMTGTSFLYTFSDAQEGTRKPVQYYEQCGNRGIWQDGWKLVTNHLLIDRYEDDTWELYHTDVDYSEAHNVAEQYPEKVEVLKALWFAEAGKNGVFPLGTGSHLARTGKQKLQDLEQYRVAFEEVTYRYHHVIEPFRTGRKLFFNQRNHEIDIRLTHHRDWEGTLYAGGHRYGGYTAFIKDNRLHYTYNSAMHAYYRAVTEELPEGEFAIRIVTRLTGPASGNVTLFVNGAEAASVQIEKFFFGLEINFSVKDGNVAAVDPDTELPFEYPGVIEEIVFHAEALEIDVEKALAAMMQTD